MSINCKFIIYRNSFHFVLVAHHSNVILYSASESYQIPTYIPVELQIKYEHSSRNLECLTKLSAPIAEQHLYVALLSVLTTRYRIPYKYLTVKHHICSTRIPPCKVLDLYKQAYNQVTNNLQYIYTITIQKVLPINLSLFVLNRK